MNKNKKLSAYLDLFPFLRQLVKHTQPASIERLQSVIRRSSDALDLAFSIRLAEAPSMWLLIPSDADDDRGVKCPSSKEASIEDHETTAHLDMA